MHDCTIVLSFDELFTIYYKLLQAVSTDNDLKLRQYIHGSLCEIMEGCAIKSGDRIAEMVLERYRAEKKTRIG